MDEAFRPGVSGFGVHRLGQPGSNQPIESPIGERPTHGEHSSHRPIGSEFFRDGEPMRRTFSEEAEDGVLGERKLRFVHAQHPRW